MRMIFAFLALYISFYPEGKLCEVVEPLLEVFAGLFQAALVTPKLTLQVVS